jgi:hypothetical protein
MFSQNPEQKHTKWVKTFKTPKEYRNWVIIIAPIWETIVFQWVGLVFTPLILPILTVESLVFPILGILWATVGFSLAHTFTEWLLKENKKKRNFVVRLVCSLIFSIPFLPALISLLFSLAAADSIYFNFYAISIIPCIITILIHSVLNREKLRADVSSFKEQALFIYALQIEINNKLASDPIKEFSKFRVYYTELLLSKFIKNQSAILNLSKKRRISSVFDGLIELSDDIIPTFFSDNLVDIASGGLSRMKQIAKNGLNILSESGLSKYRRDFIKGLYQQKFKIESPTEGQIERALIAMQRNPSIGMEEACEIQLKDTNGVINS